MPNLKVRNAEIQESTFKFSVRNPTIVQKTEGRTPLYLEGKNTFSFESPALESFTSIEELTVTSELNPRSYTFINCVKAPNSNTFKVEDLIIF